jgi:hypothetical protein
MEVIVKDIQEKGSSLIYVTEKRLIDVNENYGMITMSPVEKTNDEQYAKLIQVLFIEDKEPHLGDKRANFIKYTARTEDGDMEFSVTIRKSPTGTTVELIPIPPSPVKK